MKIDLPGLLREKLPSGNVRYRVRVERRKAKRVRLYVEPGQPDFMEHYHAARRGIVMKRPKTALVKPTANARLAELADEGISGLAGKAGRSGSVFSCHAQTAPFPVSALEVGRGVFPRNPATRTSQAAGQHGQHSRCDRQLHQERSSHVCVGC